MPRSMYRDTDFKRMRGSTPQNKSSLKQMLVNTAVVLAVVFFYLLHNVVSSAQIYEPKVSDAALILGHSLNKDNMPSDWLEERLQKGLELYENEYCTKIIVSGGEGPLDNIAVSLAMMEWLKIQGVNEGDIILEDMAGSTYENFKYTKKLADEFGIESIIVVTNDFHIYRAMEIGENFFENISGAYADTNFGIRKILAYAKEPFSLIKYYLVDEGVALW